MRGHALRSAVARGRRSGPALALATLLAALPGAAQSPAEPSRDRGGSAQTTSDQGESSRRANYVSLRFGGSSSNETGHPDACLEATSPWMIGLEACGTGAGIWHDSRGAELAHFRLELSPVSFPLAGGYLVPQVGAGFAELQVAADEPGFRFSGAGAGDVETAGPEVSLSLKGQYPLAYGFEAVAEMNAGAAYLPDAPALVGSYAAVQPFAMVTLGVGF